VFSPAPRRTARAHSFGLRSSLPPAPTNPARAPLPRERWRV
jgi:hypothetical protein